MTEMSDLQVTPEEMPEWLNNEFVANLELFSSGFEIKKVQHACKKGENFASKIYRVQVSSDGGEIKSLIMKSRPIGTGFSEEFVKKFNIFPKEIEMYQNIDHFEKYFLDINHEVVFAPKCLKVTDKPTDILIIEDLCAKGYESAQKMKGMKMNEMRKVLEKLAKFHAASAIHFEIHGEYDKKFARGIYNHDMKDIFDQSYDFNFSLIINEFLSTWPNLDKRVIDKMRNWRDHILAELVRTMERNPNQFNCLNHGDAWVANILFKYDSCGEPIDCQFVDFQQSVYTSPAVDLISLIFTSAEITTKLQSFEYYVKFYHEELVKALTMLAYTKKIPTLKELYLDVLDRAFLAVWHCIAILPTCFVENVQESSSDNLLGENEEGQNYKKKLYNNDRYIEHMTDLLTYFDSRGLVDLC